MENPFKIKGIAKNESFYNRKKELEYLKSNVLEGRHTLVIAPRRFGKSSLLMNLADQLEKEKLVTAIYIDLFKCTSINDFVKLLGKAIVKNQSSALDKILALIKKGLPKLSPVITISAQGEPEFSVNFEENNLSAQALDELLNWYDSKQGKTKKLLIIDEFQEIAQFDSTGHTEKVLRSIIQKLENTTVLFSGSLPSLLKEMFFDKKRAFFQSVLKMELEYTPIDESIHYLANKMKKLNNKYTKELITELVKITEGHPYYTQLAGYYAWNVLAQKNALNKSSINQLVDLVINAIFDQERITFENAISNLTNQQRQIFRSICQEPYAKITSIDFIKRHNMPAISSIRKGVKKLVDLGFVMEKNKTFKATDPLLALWWTETN